ncbi:ShlB/FhaC/HecB family hemolysin secretion/activation protein [Sphingomonas crusticola]|uniref:ShlB/FhaC/HecB family hemolysin secretion/activation protein n=1 Tax=Sphingomonas crusticola TaxID=1697973 RepID=UPI000E25F3B2|nr:ShlB/FhaC/HecB family hemolysin secretion/activation protein [Sphingomonas crusticola]
MRLSLALAIAASLLPATAVAQSAARNAIVPPDRADQRPAARPGRGRAVAQLPRQRAAAPIRAFTLNDVIIEGSTLPAADLTPAYSRFLGTTVDATQIQAIVDALGQIYGRSDVALYTVLAPQQSYAGGVLRLSAVEGYVESAVVRGAGSKMRRLVGRYIAPLMQEKPLRKHSLQRYVSLIRDVPGLNPVVDFERGGRPGAVKLVVVAKPRPFQVAFGLNDRGTALLGKTQGQIDGFANSLLFGGDQLRLSYARPIRAPYYQSASIAYAVPLNADGLTLQVNAGKLRTRPRDLPLKGSATSAGGQISYAAIRSFNTNLVVSAGIDGVNSDNAFLGFTFSNERTRAMRFAASFTLSSDTNQLTASATQSFGLDAFGARVLDPTVSDLGFRKTNLRLADNQLVGKIMVLRLNGSAQFTHDRLPSTEQFTLGGDEFGRAYETALISGDTGYAGSAELALHPTKLPPGLNGSETYLFVDGGRVRYRSRNGFASSESRLGSWGGGARIAVLNRAIFQIEAARGFNNPVFYEDRKKWRVILSLRTII